MSTDREETTGRQAGDRRLDGRQLGSLIGGGFGLVYVEANCGALPTVASALLRISAAAAFLGLLVLLAQGRGRSADARPGGGSHGQFGRGYWSIVGAEVAAIVVGAAILRGPLDLPHAVVAWVSVVVGVHFLALAAIWKLPFIRALGVAIGTCGAVGIVAAVAGASVAVTPALGGVLPGLLLLGAAYQGLLGPGTIPTADTVP